MYIVLYTKVTHNDSRYNEGDAVECNVGYGGFPERMADWLIVAKEATWEWLAVYVEVQHCQGSCKQTKNNEILISFKK